MRMKTGIMPGRISRALYQSLGILILAGLILVPASAGEGPDAGGLPPISEIKTANLVVTCKNIDSGAALSGVRIYLDGGFAGETSGKGGQLVLLSLAPGNHTIRAVQRGYLENIITVHVPDTTETTLALHPEKLIPIGSHGPVEERLDIVFVPSGTMYNCTQRQKIPTDIYTGNEEKFRSDVNMLIEKRLLVMNDLTRNQSCLPDDAMQRFNFYYYSHPGDFADAFKGCAGTLPEDFWDEAPFADVAIIVYPTYRGTYTGPPCESNGCASGMGPGIRSWFKAPADSGSVFMHEAGHAVFGLIDTYCGETYYTQNDPSPNVWSSQAGCTGYARARNWDPSLCRRITQKSKDGTSSVCQKEYWHMDPEPDLMGMSLSRGKLGNASTLRIHYMLDNINRWNR